MKNIIAALVTTTTFGLVATVNFTQPVRAATLTYNLGGGNATDSLFTYNSDSSSNRVLTVTGGEAGTSRDIRRRSDGLGVVGVGNPSLPGQIDGRSVDGEMSFESLRLDFNKKVRIESATFSRLQNNDGFRLFVDRRSSPLVRETNNINSLYDFSSLSENGRTGTEFRFTVAEENDDYRLQSITVVPVPEATPIVSLLGFGLVGLLSYRKFGKC